VVDSSTNENGLCAAMNVSFFNLFLASEHTGINM